MRKTREPSGTRHTSDVLGGTDLFNSSGTKSSNLFHPLRHSHDKFYQALLFSCAALKSCEESGYEANVKCIPSLLDLRPHRINCSHKIVELVGRVII